MVSIIYTALTVLPFRLTSTHYKDNKLNLYICLTKNTIIAIVY